MRLPAEWPLRGGEVVTREIGTGLYESLRVQRDTTIEPFRGRRGACHDEDVLDVMTLGRIVVRLPLDTLEVSVAFERRYLRARSQRNCRVFLDAPDQIARHRVGQSSGSDEHVHLSGALREKHGGLASGVTSSDHDHFLALAQLRLDERRAVIDPCSLELRDILEGQFSVFRTRRDDDSTRRHAWSMVDFDRVSAPCAVESCRALRNYHLGSELLCLRVSTGGELPTRNA